MRIEMQKCKIEMNEYFGGGKGGRQFQELVQAIARHLQPQKDLDSLWKIHKHLVPLAIEAFYFYTLHHSF